MSIRRWIRDFARRPGDTEAEAFSKALILAIALSCSVCGFVWGFLYLAVFGPSPVAVLPFSFSVIVGGATLISARIRDHRPLIHAQIMCIVWIPALIHWTIGSTSGSGLVIAWSFLGPIGALIFLSFRQALVWMGIFVLIVLVSTLLQPALLGAPLPVPAPISAVFFAMNVGVASIVVFAAAAWFVKTIQRELALRLEANRALVESHRQLEASQQVIIQSEKMVALGRLSAGMAHELNNPAAAALRGAGQLREAVEHLVRSSVALGGVGLGPEQVDRLDRLVAVAEERAQKPLETDAIDRIDREAAVEEALEARSLTALEAHAATLVELGIDAEELGALHELLGEHAVVPALERAALWHMIVSLISEIEHGSSRVTAIVGALKSYTYLDRGKVQTVDVNAGLGDTLLMMNSVLRDGVKVRRELDAALPPITAQGGGLNQVWTNLISNAVEAMGGEGELTVRTRREQNHAVVEIVDSGPGIAAEVQDCLFDPFVTTKPVGEGTGLGLYLSRNIIEQQHGGSLEVESRPGRTRFEVRLPLSGGDASVVDGSAGSRGLVG